MQTIMHSIDDFRSVPRFCRFYYYFVKKSHVVCSVHISHQFYELNTILYIIMLTHIPIVQNSTFRNHRVWAVILSIIHLMRVQLF